MTTQQEAYFEAPAAHEAAHYSNPEDYSNPEFEWESEATHYSNPEAYSNPYSNPEEYSNPESEWESEATHYSNPYSNPEAYSNPYSNPEDYSNPEFEWETEATHYSNPYSNPEFEFEDEGEYFFKRIWRGVKRVARVVAPLAKRFAPFAARALAGMIPGVGAIAGPLAGKLTSALLREGEMEAVHLEAEFFGTNEAEAEVGHTEQAHEAALTELMAAEAVHAESEAEAEAMLATTLPLTISIMGGRRALQPVMPTLAQANGRLVSVLRRQGPPGRQLLRTVPTIQRQAIATMRAAARSGQPITGPLAVRAMAAATHNVLSNPRRVQRSIERNAVLRYRCAPPIPRRAAVFVPNRIPPFNPRRTAGFRPMRATRQPVGR